MSLSRLSKIADSPIGAVTIRLYAGVVFFGFLKGAGCGSDKYRKWEKIRKTVTINSEYYDPIINTCRDTGVWGGHVLIGGFGSAAIVATAPISVPLLLAINKEKEKQSNE
jgi:hypothetical protein